MTALQIGLASSDADHVVSEARTAEANGFDYLACGEHLFFHGPVPNAFIQLAAAAGATERIRLLSAITPLAMYPAALAAKLAVELDRVSGGRFEFGVGAAGEFPAEFEAAGVEPSTRFRRFEEGLRVVRSLFSGERTSFQGEFTTISDLALQPGPVQPGGPPIWLGGRKQAAMKRAGRFADVWLPYMVTPQVLAETLAEVRQHAVDAGRKSSDVAGAVFLWAAVGTDAEATRRAGIEVVSKTYNQDFSSLADKYLVLGSPDDVIARLREFVAAGAEKLILQLSCEREDRADMIRLLGKEVLPAFTGSMG